MVTHPGGSDLLSNFTRLSALLATGNIIDVFVIYVSYISSEIIMQDIVGNFMPAYLCRTKITKMEKDTLRDRIKKSIDELFASIDELDSKKDELKDKTKAKYSEIMAEIKHLEAVLESKHRRVQDSDDHNWEEAKKAFKQSAKSFREAFENLASYLKKSPPPPGEEKKPDYEI